MKPDIKALPYRRKHTTSGGFHTASAEAVWKLLRHEKPSVRRVCSKAFGLLGFMQPAGGADIASMKAV
jgi:hypothetical protein